MKTDKDNNKILSNQIYLIQFQPVWNVEGKSV